MTRVIENFSLSTIGASDPGSLVVFGDMGENDPRQIAIVAEHSDEEESLVILLNDQHEPHPIMRFVDPRRSCLVANEDWLIEPEHDERSYPRASRPRRYAGILSLTPHGWVLSAATSGVDQLGRFNTEWRNIDTGAQAQREANSASFVGWQVWLTDEDRYRPAATPFFKYSAGEVVRRS